MSKKAGIIISVVLAVAIIFGLSYFLYDSPAKYVTTADGSIYLNDKGEPVLYYKDMFGLTFYDNNGKREYAAVPAYISDTGTATVAGGTLTDASK